MKKAALGLIAIIVIIGAFLIGTQFYQDSGGPATQGERSNTAGPSAGETLDYTNKALTSFPPELLGRTDIVSLDLENNQIAALPEEIASLKNLSQLLISNNRLNSLPVSIGQMASLQKLDVSNNRLSSVPSELGNLTQLKELDLRGNSIAQADIDQLKARLDTTTILY